MAVRISSVYNMVTWIKVRIKYIILSILIVAIVDHFGIVTHLFEVDYKHFAYPLEVPMEDILVAMKTGSEPPHQQLNTYAHSYIIRNEKKCQDVDTREYEKVVILYIIKSALNHQKRRDVIRKSWGWEQRFSDVVIKRIFVVGVSKDDNQVQRKIYAEQAQNNDMVQVDFVDSYYNNTLKTMLSFRWVIQNCPKSQFIMFSDDDMYVSTKNLLKFIRNPFNKRVGFRRRRDIEAAVQSEVNENSKSESSNKNDTIHINFPLRQLTYDSVLSAFDGRLFAGFVFNSSPMRHKSSKWYMTLEEYPFSRYPPYVTAGAYVLSYPALVDMYFTSLFTKSFKFDDVYLGIVAKKCNIYPLHNDHFHFWKKAYEKDEYANVIASHGYDNPTELKAVWEEQRSLGHA